MNYFSKSLCELLQKKGVVSESGMWWKNGNHTEDKLLDSLSVVPEYQQELLKKVVPAYVFEDLCNKENAIKIWGEPKHPEIVPMYWELATLLQMKLNGEDIEQELLKQLGGV
jgi:hypothetical protein